MYLINIVYINVPIVCHQPIVTGLISQLLVTTMKDNKQI